MDSISILTYYLDLLAAYGKYYLLYIIDIFRDYPPTVKIAAFLFTVWFTFILILCTEFARQAWIKRRRKRKFNYIREKFEEPVSLVLNDETVKPNLSRDEMIKVMGLDQPKFIGKKLLSGNIEKQVFCRMVYDMILSDRILHGRQQNIQQLMEIFNIPKFLEDDVNYGNRWKKVSAINMLRTFKLYISPWVINKLMENKSMRIRRLAMYSTVRSNSENELEAFETEFFEKNCCIQDEIVIGYELQRRRKSGLRLPSMALWASRFNSPVVKTMLVRMMRRFEQQEYCSQLMPLFNETHDKKLIEEICRTWGYLRYIESEEAMTDAFALQTDDTKVAIMHAIARLNTGRRLNMFTYAYSSSHNPHVRFEALRCLYNYGKEGKAKLFELEKEANDQDKRFFAFFRNPITMRKIPLDEVQIYHQSVETYYTMN